MGPCSPRMLPPSIQGSPDTKIRPKPPRAGDTHSTRPGRGGSEFTYTVGYCRQMLSAASLGMRQDHDLIHPFR